MHGRHSKVRPHHWVAGTVVAVVVAVTFALGLRWFDSTRSDEPSSHATDSAAASSTPDEDQLLACRGVWQAQSAALDAAGRSLEQWRIHVDAMNQLVAGDITLAQAKAFWNRTRQGAAARVAKFDTADGKYADVAPLCQGLGDRASPGAGRPLEECLAGVRARDRAINAGIVAVATWKHHIMDMELLRAGQITPAQATRMWLKSWRAGVAQLDTFTEVRKSAADAGSC